jgi:hypothetical protein
MRSPERTPLKASAAEARLAASRDRVARTSTSTRCRAPQSDLASRTVAAVPLVLKTETYPLGVSCAQRVAALEGTC